MTNKKLDKYGNCPECRESWDAGDISKKSRKHYSEPFKFSKIIGIYDRIKDMTVQYVCPFCEARWDRFTGELVEVTK